MIERFSTAGPTLSGCADRYTHCATLSEFEGIREQILKHLLQPRRVRIHRVRQVILQLNRKREVAASRHGLERLPKVGFKVVEGHSSVVGSYGSGFNF